MICEYPTVSAFAESFGFNEDDLILTNEYIYRPLFSALNLRAQVLFQEQFGMGEPTDQMVDAILAALHTLHYKRIVAVGGGTIIDIAKILAVAEPGDYTDQLYDKMTQLTKVHPLFIIPTTCGTGSEVTNISIVNRTAKGVKQGIVSGAMYADQAILIPELLQSLPYKVFATSSIDAMIHAVESYLSPNASETSEMFSMQALKILLTAWREAAASEDKDACGISPRVQLCRYCVFQRRLRLSACTELSAGRHISCGTRRVQSSHVCAGYADVSEESTGRKNPGFESSAQSDSGLRTGKCAAGAVGFDGSDSAA